MTQDTLPPATDDTAAAPQETVPPEVTPDATGGEPAPTTPQAAADKAPETETPEPVDYDSLTVPDEVEVDEEVFGEFKAFATERNLSKEDVQRLADLSIKMTVKQQELARQERAAWVEASKTDPEFGGEKFAENLAIAKVARDTFGSPELKAILDVTGIGNHPAVIRAFYRVGKQISEDGRLVTSGASPAGVDARRIYASSNMNP
jgi:hypothetical protein